MSNLPDSGKALPSASSATQEQVAEVAADEHLEDVVGGNGGECVAGPFWKDT